ncbi:MAG: hypothetical protein D3922_04130 [Candidatus Electrothrix sp. AR1]|nr:hypothetical protein [Candidatus Electrothrix sp. AR1]
MRVLIVVVVIFLFNTVAFSQGVLSPVTPADLLHPILESNTFENVEYDENGLYILHVSDVPVEYAAIGSDYIIDRNLAPYFLAFLENCKRMFEGAGFPVGAGDSLQMEIERTEDEVDVILANGEELRALIESYDSEVNQL